MKSTGEYSVTQGSSACTSCDAGFYSTATAATSADTCQECPAGQYSETPGSTTCSSCDAGYYSTATAATSSDTCLACPPGQYSDTPGSTTCSNCDAGYYSTALAANSSATCQACPAGQYSESPGSSACTSCDAGFYSTALAANSSATCQACQPGQYSESPGSPACSSCDAGYYSTATAATSPDSCQECPAGQYSESPGSTGCTNCNAGFYSTATAAKSADTCQACPVGSASPTPGANSSATCVSCPAGQYAESSGSSACTSCDAGYASSATGANSSDTCQSCPAGYYSDSPGSAVCTGCSAGDYSTATAANSSATCLGCPAGHYSESVGSTGCASCDPGYASSTIAADSSATCTACPTGQYAQSYGSPVCTSCGAGYASNVTAATSPDTCQACPAGQYTDAPGSASCTWCQAGTYSTTHAANTSATCEACPSGTYSAEDGFTSCQTCVQNTYSTGGAALCSACPASRVTSAVGATTVLDCVNPGANFAQATVALVASIAVAVVYILYGRMNAVAFGRKRHLQEAGKTYIALIAAIDRVPLIAERARTSRLAKFCILVAFILAGSVVFLLTALTLSFLVFGQVFFSAMIIWRNVRFAVSVPFAHQVKVALQHLAHLLKSLGPLGYVFGGIYTVVVTLSSLEIFNVVRVTCVGSQAPITMLTDVVMFVVVGVLIECDVAAFLATGYCRAHRMYRTIISDSRARYTVDYPLLKKLRLWLVSSFETAVVTPRLVVGVMQYAVSFISVAPFFAHNGRHASSDACDHVNGAPNIDTALAYLTTILAYCLIPVVLYTLAKLFVPRLLLSDQPLPKVARGGLTHAKLIESLQRRPVTLEYSFLPSVDYFVSWRFKWAYNRLQSKKYSDETEFMFLRNDDPVVDPPTGIGLCPLVSTVNRDFQFEWEVECGRRLPHYGAWYPGARVVYAHVVLNNYRTIMRVLFGMWDDDTVAKFNIINTLGYNGLYDVIERVKGPEASMSVDTPLYTSFRKLVDRVILSWNNQLHTGPSPADGAEYRLSVSALLAAEVSTRATLFLMLPFGSLITTYVGYTASSPLFCRRARTLRKLLPALLVFDSHLLAEKRVRDMGSYARWKARWLSFHIFITESRLLTHLFNLLCYFITLSVTFFPSKPFLTFGAIVIVAYCMVSAIYPVIILANILEIQDEEQPEETAKATSNSEPDTAKPSRASVCEEPHRFSAPTRDVGHLQSNYDAEFYLDADEDREAAAAELRDMSASVGTLDSTMQAQDSVDIELAEVTVAGRVLQEVLSPLAEQDCVRESSD
jgi:hypothetical protein